MQPEEVFACFEHTVRLSHQPAVRRNEAAIQVASLGQSGPPGRRHARNGDAERAWGEGATGVPQAQGRSGNLQYATCHGAGMGGARLTKVVEGSLSKQLAA